MCVVAVVGERERVGWFDPVPMAERDERERGTVVVSLPGRLDEWVGG